MPGTLTGARANSVNKQNSMTFLGMHSSGGGGDKQN